jgi:hypothetical protein
MNKMKCLAWLPVLLAFSLICCNCGKNDSRTQTRAFDKAPADIKSAWDLAVAADKTNDYYTASASYAKVLSQESQLTPKQLAALESASRDLSQRMVAAASNGNDAAKQALARLMREQNQR